MWCYFNCCLICCWSSVYSRGCIVCDFPFYSTCLTNMWCFCLTIFLNFPEFLLKTHRDLILTCCIQSQFLLENDPAPQSCLSQTPPPPALSLSFCDSCWVKLGEGKSLFSHLKQSQLKCRLKHKRYPRGHCKSSHEPQRARQIERKGEYYTAH